VAKDDKGIKIIKSSDLSWLDEMIKEAKTVKDEISVEEGKRYLELKGKIKDEFIPGETLTIPGVEEERKTELIERYGDVEIIKIEGEPVPLYRIRRLELRPEEWRIVNDVKEEAIAEIAIDPEEIEDPRERMRIFSEEVRRILLSKYPDIPKGRVDLIVENTVREMIGYGRLDLIVSDPNLEEIMVIGTGKPVYVYHRKHGMLKTNVKFSRDEEIMVIIEKIGREVGRRIDQQTPLLDARLPDGSRVNATIPPVSLDGPTITIRKFREDPLTVVDLVNFKTMSPDLSAFLWLAVDGLGVKPANILVSGGTASGKTTTLNTLVGFIPERERVISIEDTAELQLPLEHWVRFETRPPNIEGRGEITMDDLMKNALRMRPDRIIVGEVRGPEARTMFTAMNTGHDGCMGTIHANTAHETITRLINPPCDVPEIMIPALDLIIMQARIYHRRKGLIRRITEVAEVVGMEGGKPQLSRIYRYDPKLDETVETGVPSHLRNAIAEYAGMTGEEIREEIERRKTVIEYLRIKNMRSIHQVHDLIQEYYTDSYRVLERIAEEMRIKEVI